MARGRAGVLLCHLAMFVAVLGASRAAQGKTIHVSKSGNDANTGLSWATAKLTVQAGLNAAVPADQVWVAAGTYVEQITLPDSVALYGGFAGSETELAQRSWATNATILDGNALGSVVTVQPGATSSTRIDGFTIRNGTGTPSGNYNYGGGIYCDSASPTIVNNTITGNRTTGPSGGFGGGIYCSKGLIANNRITSNSASFGGGVFCNHGSPLMVNNTVVGNSASLGGGFMAQACWATIANNIIAFNSSGVRPGDGGPVLRNNCVYNPGGANYIETNPGLGDISVDPQLRSAGRGELHLKAGSPCIDAGLDDLAQAAWSDFDGEPRVLGAHVDIGADEFNPDAPRPAVIFVSTSGNDVNDGLDWTAAKQSVQAGLDTAAAGDQVWVAAGTYVERITLKISVALYGGFAGSETELTQRNWVTNATIVDGDASGSVVTVPPGATGSTRIDGFTIRNGTGTPSGNYRYGGGIYCNSASPTIVNNTITGNTTPGTSGGSGGGIYCVTSQALIANNRITSNSATSGGGVLCDHGSPSLINNTVVGNTGEGFRGLVTSATLANNIFAFNSSGVRANEGSPVLRNNCVHNPEGTNYIAITPGTGDITADPQLRSVSRGDLHLKAGSPCINAGFDGLAQAGGTDFDGEPRVLGTHVDIGADEFNPDALRPAAIFVSTSGNDVNDGLDWGAAKKSVQAGLAAAAPGDQVWVAVGTYVERITLKASVALYGGFAGCETELTQRNWLTNATILDGNADGSVVTARSPVTASTRIDGFTIRNGSGTRLSAFTYGGGIYCHSASPTITNNTVIGNTITGIAASRGGGLYCFSSQALIVNNAISGNNADFGGGIYCDSGSPSILNNTIVGNGANSVGFGGGIHGQYADLTIGNNIVAFNSSGVSREGGSVTCTANCVYNPAGANYFNLPPGVGDIAVDPQLRSADHGNLHLSPGSPCIDGGDDTVVQPGWVDLDGEPRQQGLHVDIGVDEFDPAAPGPLRVLVSTSGDDANDGLTWATSKQSVQAGLDSAAPGDQVWVASGVYTECITLTRGVALYGGFAGNEDELDERNWRANATILDGHSAGSVVTAPAGAKGSTRVDGFSIRHGSGTPVDGYSYGGGIYCPSASPTVANNTVTGNTATGIAGGYGGGIYCFSSQALIVNNTISGNHASSGGGLYCSSGAPTITNNIIRDNIVSTGSGGGIYCHRSATFIAGNAVIGNSTVGQQGHGGGILTSDSSVTLINNTVAANSAGGQGAVAIGGGASGLISNNIIAFNSSGVRVWSGSPILRNNCIYNPGGFDYSGLSAGPGDISADPQLLALEFGEVHLKSDSPCIDAGHDGDVHGDRVDMDGEPRIHGAHVDMGADEFNGITPGFVPRVIRVQVSGDDSNDGSTWSLAKRTVQAGIDAARSAGGEVWVAAGTYSERITLGSWVHLYGGFAAWEETLNQRNFVTNASILDAGGTEGGSVVTAAQPGYRTSAIDGFTIRNGTGTVVGNSRYGGGVYCLSASPTIANNTITSNTAAEGAGGGIYCSGSSPAIFRNTISANSADAGTGGGGIYCSPHISPTIYGNTIVGNTAIGGAGGGIHCGSSTSVLNNVITGNSADAGSGGGVYCALYSLPVIVGNTFTSNISGAVYCDSLSTPSIQNNIVAFNAYGIRSVTNANPVLRNNCVYNPRNVNYWDLSAGVGDIMRDPLFVNRLAGDHRLQPGSPCIDSGYSAGVPSGVLTDLLGHMRFFDDPATADCRWSPGNCGTAPIVDMGAYEFIPPIPGDFGGDGDVDVEDLAVFIACASRSGVAYVEDCAAGNFDGDNDMDMDDFGIFQRCYRGADRAADPNCAN